MRALGPLASALTLLLACGGGGESPAETGGAGAGDAAGGGGVGGGAQAEPLYVSFVAEEGPGNGPALLRMVNDTDGQILSLTLPTGEAFSFYLIDPLTSSDYALIASDDMLEDAILSLHTLDTCVRRPFSAMNGPTSLEPGRAYSLHVSLEDGFIADIVEEAQPEPYLGVRAIISDPAKPTQVGAKSMLYLEGATLGEVAFEDIYDELPAPFVRLDAAELSLERVRFVDLAGVERVAEGPLGMSGAFGYTVYVGAAPADGASAHVFTLAP